MGSEVVLDNAVTRRQPSIALAALFAAGAIAGPLLVILGAALVHPDDLDRWGPWAAVGAGAAALAAAPALWWRYRLDGRVGWMFLAVGASSWSIGMSLGVVRSGVLQATGELLELGWPVGALALLAVHTKVLERPTRLVYVVDAVLMATCITFVVWELIIRREVGDVSRLSVGDQVSALVHPLGEVLVASFVLMLVLIGRSPARLAFLVGSLLLLVGDIIRSANVADASMNRALLSLIAWVLAFAAIAAMAGLPSGARLTHDRPQLSRQLVVNTTVTAAFAVATFRYVAGGTEGTVPSVVMGLATGVLWSASQLAAWNQSARWSDRLNENILELDHSHSELRELLDDLPDAVVVLGGDGRIREANRGTVRLTGQSHGQLLGRYFANLVRPEERERLVDLWFRLRDGEDLDVIVFPFDHPDGHEVLLEIDVNLPLTDPDRVVIVLSDITERVLEDRRLERARERFRLAFQNAPTGMALASVPSGVLIDVNEPLARMLGRSRSSLMGTSIQDITHPDDWSRGGSLLQAAVPDELDSRQMERRYIHGDGHVVWARTWVSMMDEGEGGMLAIAHIEDVTEQRHSAERLEWAATHDGLTTLPNRFRFLDRLGGFLESSAPGSIAVLFIDIDNFKVINDSLGHDAGDQLLRTMSERLRTVVRDRDLLGRFGGDEFIVMLRDVSGSYDPVQVAERLREEIALPVIIDGAELFVTASIGIAVSDREGVTTTELMRDADAAMYRAKARGRDCVEVFAPGGHDASVLTLRTTNELRRGLERGEIVPYYQPIVELGSGHLTGFEVLARWRHPDRGLLGPEQFLPMAEETGLIGDVGAAVLRASLAQLGQWRAHSQRFAELSVSVNVSVRQLMGSHLGEVVAEALAEAGVAASALWLEITETALMADVKAATVALRELRSLGLHLAVDDFGTGYSSLTYLKRFPVEAIKVDRSFVNGLGIDQEDSTIVEAVVNLGHSLGLLVIAEGVETPLQLSRLREVGCDRGQGYLFGRPRPAELIEAEYSLL